MNAVTTAPTITNARLGSHDAGADRGEVEKVQHLGRIGHAGNHKAETEDQADDELNDDRHGGLTADVGG